MCIRDREIPFVYRTHDKPDSEKIAKLSTFINNFGYTLHIGTDEVHPKELQKLLMKVDGTDEESLISRLTLRSMKQARYTTCLLYTSIMAFLRFSIEDRKAVVLQ